MDPESKRLLEKTYELVEENHKLLRKVRSVQRRTVMFQALKTIIIVGIGVGAFYFLQPYIDQFNLFVQETGMTIDKFKSMLPK